MEGACHTTLYTLYAFFFSFSIAWNASVLLPVVDRIENATFTIWSAILCSENSTEYILFDTSTGYISELRRATCSLRVSEISANISLWRSDIFLKFWYCAL